MIILSFLSLVLSTSVKEENKTFPEIVECFLNQKTLIEDINAIIEMIKTQDYSQIITILIKGYSNIQNAIKECVTEELNLEWEKKAVHFQNKFYAL